MFSEYKWYAIAIAFVVYSFGVWHVSGQVSENEFNKERLAAANEIIRIKTFNDNLAGSITTSLQTGLAKINADSKKNQKDLLNEMSKDSRYSTCLVTDSVHDLYKRKLQNQ